MMSVAWFFLSMLAAGVCCGFYLRLARRWQIIDEPNQRSAHTQATPRGGGAGLFTGLLLSVIAVSSLLTSWPPVIWQLLLVAALLVVVGFIDDRSGAPVSVRFALYSLAAIAGVLIMLWPAPVWLMLAVAFYLLWMMNLFNFMDGIDGIAASETIFACLAVAALATWRGGDSPYVLFCLLVAGASAGFLCWNWAPARLFMGDAGSIWLGFLLASLSVLGEISGAMPLLVWWILLAVFIADASQTLLWRAFTGQAVTQAHSLHLYQRLARHWRSHSRVVQLMLAYNVLYLLPLAICALLWPQWQWLSLVAAYLPLLLAAIKTVKLP